MTYGDEPTPTRRRRRWPRRLAITLVVLLVLLGGLVVVADRVGVNVAERRIADEVQTQLSGRGVYASAPDVEIGGFPFLTQVISERYQRISIEIRDLSTSPDGQGIRIPLLDVQARDISAPLAVLRGGPGEIVAGSVEGTATIGYASVATLTNQPDLRLAERDGQLEATLPVSFAGREFVLTGNASVEVDAGKLRLRFSDLDAEGLPRNDAIRSAINGLATRMAVDVTLPALPFGIELREVRVSPEGLAIAATASDVPLNGGVG